MSREHFGRDFDGGAAPAATGAATAENVEVIRKPRHAEASAEPVDAVDDVDAEADSDDEI